MANIPVIVKGVWPQPKPTHIANPNEPTAAATQSRILLHQRFDQNNNVWIADFVAGPNSDGVSATNQDGMEPGTYYTLTSSTQFTGL